MTLHVQASKKPPKRISWEAFQRKFLSREDHYKYEWLDGYVEKTPKTMNKNQFFILNNLMEFLTKLKLQFHFEGQLIAEGDTFFNQNHRRPDIAFYTKQQIEVARQDKNVVPEFVVEIISSKDQMNKVHKKMEDYRAADVKVIWHILPELNTVHVYEGKQMTICEGDDICSADSVIKGFQISVNKVFE